MDKLHLLARVAVVSASVSFASSSLAADLKTACWLSAATDWATFGLADNWAIDSLGRGDRALTR